MGGGGGQGRGERGVVEGHCAWFLLFKDAVATWIK